MRTPLCPPETDFDSLTGSSQTGAAAASAPLSSQPRQREETLCRVASRPAGGGAEGRTRARTASWPPAPGTSAISTPRCCIVASSSRVCAAGSTGTPDAVEMERTSVRSSSDALRTSLSAVASSHPSSDASTNHSLGAIPPAASTRRGYLSHTPRQASPSLSFRHTQPRESLEPLRCPPVRHVPAVQRSQPPQRRLQPRGLRRVPRPQTFGGAVLAAPPLDRLDHRRRVRAAADVGHHHLDAGRQLEGLRLVVESRRAPRAADGAEQQRRRRRGAFREPEQRLDRGGREAAVAVGAEGGGADVEAGAHLALRRAVAHLRQRVQHGQLPLLPLVRFRLRRRRRRRAARLRQRDGAEGVQQRGDQRGDQGC
mmetsp:Transcript_2198/g.6387  ORF Transcript_2198/g.6387 Transcript_2198/m.6387 type:complete len:369 (-) Transcript_2198:641-1747(-)